MRSTTLALVKDLKENNQDFEFYPSTQSQIDAVVQDLKTILSDREFSSQYNYKVSLLDIGAGDGRVLEGIRAGLEDVPEGDVPLSTELFAIEKATLQISSYREKDITLLGTEFDETNLISKNADVAYCNPPYSEFSHWIDKILSQLNFKILYVVMPKRWRDDKRIAEAIESRNICDVETIQESDFLNADRAARAEVELVRFSFEDFDYDLSPRRAKFSKRTYKITIGMSPSDPFQLFIDKELGLNKDESKSTQAFSEYSEKERIKSEMNEEGTQSNELVKSRGVLWSLLDNYDADLLRILTQYKKISELDKSLLVELGIEYKQIESALRVKLFGFRNVYWSILFDELDVLSNRLTTAHRKKLIDTLNGNALDFTHKNATYIIEYAVKMANELVEESLIDVYKNMTSEKSILRMYKSNEHVFKDDWRYSSDNRNGRAKYVLDYRFITTHHSNFSSYDFEKGITDKARESCNDLLVVFFLLGYSDVTKDTNYDDIGAGNILTISGTEPNGKRVDLLKIRYYKNGNRHLTFNQEAMLRFNATVSRLLGWVRSKEEFDEDAQNTKTTKSSVWAVGDALRISPNAILKLNDKTI